MTRMLPLFELSWYQPIIAAISASFALMLFQSDFWSSAVMAGAIAGVVTIIVTLINNIFTRKSESEKSHLTLSVN